MSRMFEVHCPPLPVNLIPIEQLVINAVPAPKTEYISEAGLTISSDLGWLYHLYLKTVY